MVLTEEEGSPYSFLNFVFVQKNHDQVPGYSRMLSHELEHIRQGHTFDVLLLDVLLIFQWFNPFIWLLRRVVRENHEYLADRAVIHSGIEPAEYKLLLLSQVIGKQIYAANHFNYSLLKNRFKMMTRIPSPRKAGIKIISGILVALALVIVFACEQKKSTPAAMNNVEASVSMAGQNGEVRISGSQEEITKVKKLLASGNYTVSSNNENGRSYLLLKAKESKSDSLADRSISGEKKNAGTDEVFTAVDKMPEFPGGQVAFGNFMAKAVRYPKEAQDKAIQGKVIVTFVVTKDGLVKDARVLRGVAPSLDKEALRVVNSLPKWIPGEQSGKKVSVAYTLPISFVLQ